MIHFIRKYIFIALGLVIAIVSIFGFNRFYEMPKIDTQHPNIDKLISNKELPTQNTNFLLSLSWSPTYCVEQDPQGKTPQCQINKPKKYRFIVHGLWPQPLTDTGGKHLTYCKNVLPKLEASIVKDYFYFMPSSGLMMHQWKKHASCGNFTQQSYFKAIDTLYKDLKIASLFEEITTTTSNTLPQIIEKITNHIPNVKAENIVIACRQNKLGEVRICLDQDYTPRKCYVSEIKSGRCFKDAKIIVPFY